MFKYDVLLYSINILTFSGGINLNKKCIIVVYPLQDEGSPLGQIYCMSTVYIVVKSKLPLVRLLRSQGLWESVVVDHQNQYLQNKNKSTF